MNLIFTDVPFVFPYPLKKVEAFSYTPDLFPLELNAKLFLVLFQLFDELHF